MVGATSPQHEPTMEEILASIRKIISEDSSEPQSKEVDVLELTQEVREEPAPAPVAPPAPPPVVAAAPAPLVTPAPPPAPAPQPAPVENDVVFASNEEKPVSSPARTEAPDHEGIFSDKARKAIDDAFADLDKDEESKSETSGAAPQSSPSVEGDSVEAVFERAVRASVQPLLNQWMDARKDDLLASVKPLIREWMDEHFPALLEGAVRDEVARVVKARGKR